MACACRHRSSGAFTQAESAVRGKSIRAWGVDALGQAARTGPWPWSGPPCRRGRGPSFRPRLVIFTKAPVGGSVKTRLARQLGVAVAMRFARHSTAALLDRLTRDPRWQTVVATTGGAHSGGRFWPRALSQGGGDLGQRMQRCLERLPPGPVVIVGTDIPRIRRAHIARALRELGRHDVVFGPAADGGYWLVGLRRRPRIRKLFEGVRWSRAETLADTLQNLHACSVYFLPELRDVDVACDFAASAGDLGRRVLPPPHAEA